MSYGFTMMAGVIVGFVGAHVNAAEPFWATGLIPAFFLAIGAAMCKSDRDVG